MNIIMSLTTICILWGTPQQDIPRIYNGDWQNRQARTTGNLAVMVVPSGENTWKGKFIGEFQGDAFEYEVTFEAVPDESKKGKKKGKYTIKGRANVDSQMYTWRGFMNNNTFYGRFSSGGPNGDFRLSRKKQS